MDLETTTSTGFYGQTVFRYANYDTPFWARNNRSAGRWHLVGDGATQYLSLTPDGAWADLARAENLRTDDDLALVRMRIWAISLAQANLADYSTFEMAEKAGFPPEALVDDDLTLCQAEGRRLRDGGYAGVVSPSAALPGAINITLFGRRISATWGTATKLASAIPCCIVAVGGPPPGLADRVRYVGDTHTGYQEYLDGVAERNREEIVGESGGETDPDDEARVRRRPEDPEAGEDALGPPS
jgi:RES domain-containing protein